MGIEIKRVVAVTGGSKGIGQAICAAFAEPGTRVYFNFSSGDDSFRQTQDLVVAAGGTAIPAQCDVADTNAVSRWFKSISEESGRLDVLVNNAGIAKDSLLLRMKEADWDTVMAVNLKGAFNCLKAAAKIMIGRRYGRIINISSIAGVAGNPGQANYSASKAGIIGLTKSSARELASRNITVNAIAPGFIHTAMTEKIKPESMEEMLKLIPLGRAGTPEDVARVAVFLASAGADYITGQVIHVNGGMYI